jgi:hypothetical protein
MKKSTLALSIAAAIGSFGLVGAANAQMKVNGDGIGQQLVFPYFTAQGDNATMLSITNTDTINGKLVKVRFRGAANSDDLFDFQVLMSPGDMWTASVSKDAATGLAKLSTSDTSCTIPASVNATFSTARLDPSATDAAKAQGTREGYVEVINMGDISATKYNALSALATTAAATSLFKTVKHVAGVAPCSADVLKEKLSTASGTTGNAVTTAELVAPTSGLTGDWIILNQANTAAWSGSATALNATTGPANAVFWPQTAGTPAGFVVQAFDAVGAQTTAASTGFTADPLFTKGVVAIQNFDLPDMSTPYDSSLGTAVLQADSATAALAVTTVSNQFVTSDSIAAVTDILMSQPTRRYHVAVNYTALADDVTTTPNELNNLAKTGTKAVAIYRNTANVLQEQKTVAPVVAGNANGSTYYSPNNMAFPTAADRTLCLNTVSLPGKDNRFDREETTPASATTNFTISPVVPAAASTVFICGETAVISVNNGGVETDSALAASVARRDTTLTGYTDGWMRFATPGASATGLPILGASFVRVANGAVNYGFSYANKVTR